MNTLLAPGPWHYTTDDHVVRDINGSPIAVVLSRHPHVHAELIAALPDRMRRVEDSKDILIRELRDRLAAAEAESDLCEDLREKADHWEMVADGLSAELDAACKRIAMLEKDLVSARLGPAHKND